MGCSEVKKIQIYWYKFEWYFLIMRFYFPLSKWMPVFLVNRQNKPAGTRQHWVQLLSIGRSLRWGPLPWFVTASCCRFAFCSCLTLFRATIVLKKIPSIGSRRRPLATSLLCNMIASAGAQWSFAMTPGKILSDGLMRRMGILLI